MMTREVPMQRAVRYQLLEKYHARDSGCSANTTSPELGCRRGLADSVRSAQEPCQQLKIRKYPTPGTGNLIDNHPGATVGSSPPSDTSCRPQTLFHRKQSDGEWDSGTRQDNDIQALQFALQFLLSIFVHYVQDWSKSSISPEFRLFILQDILETLCSSPLSNINERVTGHTGPSHDKSQREHISTDAPVTSRGSKFGHRSQQYRRDEDEDPADNRNPKRPERSTTRPAGNKELKRRLACPFALHNRAYHFCPPQKRNADIRQHISRCHLQVLHCPVCGEIFHQEEARSTHIMQNICQVKSFSHPGVTPDQWEEISNPDRVPAGNEEERWFVIWDVLFPGSNRPASPYVVVDGTETTMRVRHYAWLFRETDNVRAIAAEMTQPWVEQEQFTEMLEAFLDRFCEFIADEDANLEHRNGLGRGAARRTRRGQRPSSPITRRNRPNEVQPAPLPMPPSGFLPQPGVNDWELNLLMPTSSLQQPAYSNWGADPQTWQGTSPSMSTSFLPQPAYNNEQFNSQVLAPISPRYLDPHTMDWLGHPAPAFEDENEDVEENM